MLGNLGPGFGKPYTLSIWVSLETQGNMVQMNNTSLPTPGVGLSADTQRSLKMHTNKWVLIPRQIGTDRNSSAELHAE